MEHDPDIGVGSPLKFAPGECTAAQVNGSWRRPAYQPKIEKHEVHIWRISMRQHPAHITRLLATLSSDERVRANRLLSAHRRNRFIAARGALRAILASYLGRPAASLAFNYGTHGKPTLLAEGEDDGLSFNLSHSRDMALCAVTRGRPIGVDIEFIARRTPIEEVAERFFARTEREALKALPLSLRREAFFRCWTAKEAYIKATAEGLARPLSQFSVSATPDLPLMLCDVEWDRDEASRWTMRELRPGKGYVGAIAVRGMNCKLVCWEFSSLANP
jgi:4'-phosphopantetheinyl transferase